MAAQRFDVEGFRGAIDGVRQSRGLTWRQVAREAHVSASSLTRMAKGSRPDIDTVASLVAWAALDPAAFFPGTGEENALSMAAAYIHRDRTLTPEAASALEQLVRLTHSQLSNSSYNTPRSSR